MLHSHKFELYDKALGTCELDLVDNVDGEFEFRLNAKVKVGDGFIQWPLLECIGGDIADFIKENSFLNGRRYNLNGFNARRGAERRLVLI